MLPVLFEFASKVEINLIPKSVQNVLNISRNLDETQISC